MAAVTALTSGLSANILADLQAVFAHHPKVVRVVLFGSRATGFAKPGSDIDLAVFAPALSPGEFAQLWNELEDLPLVYTLDVLHWDDLAEGTLKTKIPQEGKVLYEASVTHHSVLNTHHSYGSLSSAPKPSSAKPYPSKSKRRRLIS
ncbi:MAG: nucleotidyltransferase domain-containing protein [Deltaproteobacteria bacterium]|nr:nucleotidyltransferase domain-containing protein [Deltaproteobacteria bacterium]